MKPNTIGYVPFRAGEQGSLRKIKVTAVGAGGHKLIVNTRTSYFLPDTRRAVNHPGEASRKPGL